MKLTTNSIALALLLLGLGLPALRPVSAQNAATDLRLSRRFSMQVRSAPLGDVAAELGKTLNVTLAVDAPLAEQRLDLHAPEANLTDFMLATGRLLSARWEASGTGGDATYRLRPGAIEASAERFTQGRRALFLQRLREIATALGRQPIEPYVADFRQKLAAAHPELPEASLAPVTADYLRQTLLLAPVAGTAQAQLAQARFVSLPIAGLAPALQQMVLQFAAASFSGTGAPPNPEAASSTGEQTANTILSLSNARLEYRIVYGDARSDLMLVIRAGIPDHWATAALTGIVAGLPDARGLQEYPAPSGDELARRINTPLSLAGLNADEAIAAVAQAWGVRAAADSFARPAIFRPGGLEALTGLTLREALDTVAESYGLFWWKQGNWYLLRHRLWPEERRVMVPDTLLRRLGSAVQGTGRLDAAAVALLTPLDDELLITLNLMGTARGAANAPISALDLNEIDLAQRGLDFYRGLIPGQQNVVVTTGLGITDMSPRQRADLAALAWDYGYILNPADPAPYFQVSPSFPTSGPPGGPLDGMVVVKFGFGTGISRAASLAMRIMSPAAPAAVPAASDEAPAPGPPP